MNFAWLHLGSVHFPIALAVVSALLALFALVTKSPARLKFVLELIIIGAVLTWAPYLTGEGAEDVVDKQGINDVDLTSYVHDHEEMAEKANIAFQIAGAIALIGWFVCRKADKFNMPLAIVALLAVAVTAGLMGWTGHLGGKIRHTEVRAVGESQPAGTGTTPKLPPSEGKETSDDDDH